MFDVLVYLLLAICVGVIFYMGYRAGYYCCLMDIKREEEENGNVVIKIKHEIDDYE